MCLRNCIGFPVSIAQSFKQPPLFISFSTLVFQSILRHISLPTVVPTVPGAVKMVVISLSFPSFNPQSINLSNSLVIVAFDAPTVWNALPDETHVSPLPSLLQKVLQNLPVHQGLSTLVVFIPGILCGAWRLFCPWKLTMVDCFCCAAPY